MPINRGLSGASLWRAEQKFCNPLEKPMRIVTILAVLVSCAAGCAQAPPKTVAVAPTAATGTITRKPTVFSQLKHEEENAAKVVDLDTLKLRSAAPTDAERDQRSFALQVLASVRSFAGDTQGAIAAHDAAYGRTAASSVNAKDAALIAASSAEDALQAIVNAAQTRQIVILNEAHHVSINRAFAMRLARELRKLGFEYLACETFSVRTGDSSSATPVPLPLSKGYPALEDGFYHRDPYFGEFLREAIRDRWKFVAYEQATPNTSVPMIERMRQREESQANNLVERIFRDNPKAKVFIYVGYAHAAKAAMPFGQTQELWMAARLKAKTGIDPLTIDQSQMYVRPDRARSPSVLLAALEQHKPRTPFVLRDAVGKPIVFGYPQGAIDFHVMFPDYASFGDATSWRMSLAERRPQAIPTELLPKLGRRMIYAFHANEPEDAVPADVVLVEAGKPVPTFMLPKGQFRYTVED
jgi:hypothetical protein